MLGLPLAQAQMVLLLLVKLYQLQRLNLDVKGYAGSAKSHFATQIAAIGAWHSRHYGKHLL